MAAHVTDIVYAPDALAAQLIVSTPWWAMIMQEEQHWEARATRVLQAVSLQADAFFQAARDIMRLYTHSMPPKPLQIMVIAKSCADDFKAMGNTFLLIVVTLQRVIDANNCIKMLEIQASDRFLCAAPTAGQLLALCQAARKECACSADFFEKRFPLLQDAVGGGYFEDSFFTVQ